MSLLADGEPRRPRSAPSGHRRRPLGRSSLAALPRLPGRAAGGGAGERPRVGRGTRGGGRRRPAAQPVGRVRASRLTAAGPPSLASPAELVYVLQTSVPGHWIPLVPVRDPEGSRAIVLQRGSLLSQDGTARPITAHGVLLSPEGARGTSTRRRSRAQASGCGGSRRWPVGSTARRTSGYLGASARAPARARAGCSSTSGCRRRRSAAGAGASQ